MTKIPYVSCVWLYDANRIVYILCKLLFNVLLQYAVQMVCQNYLGIFILCICSLLVIIIIYLLLYLVYYVHNYAVPSVRPASHDCSQSAIITICAIYVLCCIPHVFFSFTMSSYLPTYTISIPYGFTYTIYTLYLSTNLEAWNFEHYLTVYINQPDPNKQEIKFNNVIQWNQTEWKWNVQWVNECKYFTSVDFSKYVKSENVSLSMFCSDSRSLEAHAMGFFTRITY